MKRAKQHQKLAVLSKSSIFIASIIFMIGLFVTWQQLQGNQIASSPQNIQTTTEAQPSTEKLPEDHFTRHTAAPNEPRYLFIDKISVKSIVRPLGVTSDNHLEAPANIHEAGWYHKSAKPGEEGATVIDGHVGLNQAPGIFHQLSTLQPGDIVRIEKGSGEHLSYAVSKTQLYNADNVDMAAALSPVNSAKPGLNLITCAGTYSSETQTFDQRLVVYAQQL